jgi:DNA-directed RNA polymerase beta' subunit
MYVADRLYVYLPLYVLYFFVFVQHLTVPVRVNQYSIHDLTTRIRRGPKEDSGARYIIEEDGTMIDLDTIDRHLIELKFGQTVERHLIKGDLVLMNRQPTLHKPSISKYCFASAVAVVMF